MAIAPAGVFPAGLHPRPHSCHDHPRRSRTLSPLLRRPSPCSTARRPIHGGKQTSDPSQGGARADPSRRSGGDGRASVRRDRTASRRGSRPASKDGNELEQPFAGVGVGMA